MTTYTRVRVKPDTDEWLAERRGSLGASESAAVLGMSPYQTAWDVYQAKQGYEKPFPRELALVGHMSEPIIHEWLVRLSGLKVELHDGFMARSKKYPWLHATFDRVVRDGRSITPVQFKTARFPWNGDVPVHVRVQEQQEMLVAGADRALVVVLAGGRDFEYHWVERDDEFIDTQLVPKTRQFWHDLANYTPPLPMNMADQAGIWPSKDNTSITVTPGLMEAIERRNFHLAAAAEEKAQADLVQKAIGEYMQDHDTLIAPDGRVIATLRSGTRRTVDMAALETEYPEVANAVVRIGQPFKTLRMKKQEAAA